MTPLPAANLTPPPFSLTRSFSAVLPRFHHHHDRQNVVLALILFMTIVLMPTSHYAKGSYLLGCFLAGVCFCTDHHTHSVWTAQVKRVLQVRSPRTSVVYGISGV